MRRKDWVIIGDHRVTDRKAPQPIKEELLLTGALEPTNEEYPVAKIGRIKLCQNFPRHGFAAICAQPTNLLAYDFDLETSPALVALIRKFHEAKASQAPEMIIWGTGTPGPEFLYVDDLADALVLIMENYGGEEIVSVGTCEDLTIREMCERVRETMGHDGAQECHESTPDRTPRKLLDVSWLRGMGRRPQIPIKDGIEETYRWFNDTLHL